MMEEITIKSEFGHSYLVLHNNVEEKDLYLLNMIINNKMKGFLPCKESRSENELFLYYEITYKKSIEKEYENRNMSFEEIYILFQKINFVMENSNSFLLDPNFFVIDPQYMFFDLESNELGLLYVPYNFGINNITVNFPYQSRYYKLADFLLEKINHRDEHAVNIAYQFYKMSKEEFFSISAFMNYIEKERIMKDNIRVEEPEKKISEEVMEKEPEIEKIEETSKKKYILPICTGSVAGILFAGYFYMKSITPYAMYLFLASVILILFTIIKIVCNIVSYISQKKEDKFEIPIEPVTVDDYWNDNDETVFFDEDKQNLSMEMVLEWKENGSVKRYIMDSFPFIIGKLSGEARCLVNDVSISRLHAKIYKKEGAVYIQDLNSTNGTIINGIHLISGEEIIVKRGDELQLGKITFFIV